MLGKLLYVLIIAGVILAGAFALDFLAKDPGTLTLDYGERIYELTLFEAALALVIVILAIMVALTALRFLIALFRFVTGYDDNAFSFWARRKQTKGLDALSKATVALAAGDAKTARKKAEIAQNALGRPELTRLLNAQAAEMSGDEARAKTYYKALAGDEQTALVGTQGLLRHAIAEEDTERALKLAERAAELSPKNPDTLEALYTLQSQQFDWTAARETLTRQERAKLLPKPEADRRHAALALAQAEDAANLGEDDHARALSIEAAKLDPSNVEAVATAARHLIDSGSKRAATKLIGEAWRVKPHPQLAAAFAAIEPDEAPAARKRRFESLFQIHPDHAEVKFLSAELALVAEDWGSARNAIQDLRESEPSARSCAIMAAIARGEGEPDHIIRGWLARALGAPRGDASESEISHAAMLPLLIEPSDEASPVNDAGPSEDRMAGARDMDAGANAEPEDADVVTDTPEGETPPKEPELVR